MRCYKLDINDTAVRFYFDKNKIKINDVLAQVVINTGNGKTTKLSKKEAIEIASLSYSGFTSTYSVARITGELVNLDSLTTTDKLGRQLIAALKESNISVFQNSFFGNRNEDKAGLYDNNENTIFLSSQIVGTKSQLTKEQIRTLLHEYLHHQLHKFNDNIAQQEAVIEKIISKKLDDDLNEIILDVIDLLKIQNEPDIVDDDLPFETVDAGIYFSDLLYTPSITTRNMSELTQEVWEEYSKLLKVKYKLEDDVLQLIESETEFSRDLAYRKKEVIREYDEVVDLDEIELKLQALNQMDLVEVVMKNAEGQILYDDNGKPYTKFYPVIYNFTRTSIDSVGRVIVATPYTGKQTYNRDKPVSLTIDYKDIIGFRKFVGSLKDTAVKRHSIPPTVIVEKEITLSNGQKSTVKEFEEGITTIKLGTTTDTNSKYSEQDKFLLLSQFADGENLNIPAIVDWQYEEQNESRSYYKGYTLIKLFGNYVLGISEDGRLVHIPLSKIVKIGLSEKTREKFFKNLEKTQIKGQFIITSGERGKLSVGDLVFKKQNGEEYPKVIIGIGKEGYTVLDGNKDVTFSSIIPFENVTRGYVRTEKFESNPKAITTKTVNGRTFKEPSSDFRVIHFSNALKLTGEDFKGVKFKLLSKLQPNDVIQYQNEIDGDIATFWVEVVAVKAEKIYYRYKKEGEDFYYYFVADPKNIMAVGLNRETHQLNEEIQKTHQRFAEMNAPAEIKNKSQKTIDYFTNRKMIVKKTKINEVQIIDGKEKTVTREIDGLQWNNGSVVTKNHLIFQRFLPTDKKFSSVLYNLQIGDYVALSNDKAEFKHFVVDSYFYELDDEIHMRITTENVHDDQIFTNHIKFTYRNGTWVQTSKGKKVVAIGLRGYNRFKNLKEVKLNDGTVLRQRTNHKASSTRAVRAIAEKINEIVPTEVVTIEELIRIASNDGWLPLDRFRNDSAIVRGNKIYLIEGRATTGSAIHELGHVWMKLIKTQNPELHARIIEAGLKHESFGEISDLYSDYEQEWIAEEVFTNLIANAYEQDSWMGQFKTVINDFFNALRRIFNNIFGRSNFEIANTRLVNGTIEEIAINFANSDFKSLFDTLLYDSEIDENSEILKQIMKRYVC